LVVGGGVLINPAPALAALGEPASVTVTPGRRMVKVDWTAPTIPNGTVTTYVATATNTVTNVAAPPCTVNSSTFTCNISGLDPNVPIAVTVKACPVDLAECSAPKAAAATVKTGPPATPNAPTVTYTGGGQQAMHLSWVPADEGAGISYYRVTSSPAFTGETGTCTATQIMGTSCDVANLSLNVPYSFRLTAIGVNNATGTTGSSALGAASTPKVAGVPGQPDAPTVVRVSNSAASVSWTKPSGGAAVGGYLVEKTTGGQTSEACTTGATATSCDVTGLDPTASYTFTVTALGEGDAGTGGKSVTSSASGAITLGKPNTPDAPTVELGAVAGEVRVYWSAPEAGGGTVTGYVVTPTPGGTNPSTCDVGPTVFSCDLSGLATDGTAYTFQVVAKGAVDSDPSAVSDPIVSQLPDEPNKPDAALVADTPGAVTLTWDPKVSGGPVIFYTVTASGDAQTGTQSNDCGFNLVSPSCTITGLNPAATYTFTVRAYGDLGWVESDPSDPIVPDAPHGPTSAAVVLDSPTGVTVTWGPPSGGAEVETYSVTATPIGGGTSTVFCDESPNSTTSCPITGLNAAKSYTFKVTATNLAGSTDAPITATDIPGEPQAVTVALRSGAPGEVDVNWTAASGTVARYVVTAVSTDGGALVTPCTDAALDETCPFTGLNPTEHYTFTVRAENLLGGSAADPVTGVVPAAPGAPTSVTVAVTGSGEATVSWAPPTSGGKVATYEVTASSPDSGVLPSPNPCPVDMEADPDATLECVFTNLATNKSYQFTVRAVNAVDGTDATLTSPVVPGGPSTPTTVQAVLGDEPSMVTVTWAPPTGAPVDGYTVLSDSTDNTAVEPTCTPSPVTATTCTFTTLTATAPYTFKVRATNAVTSTDSVPTAPIIPDEPGPPGTVVATRGDDPGKATVTWLAPNSGGDVVSYSVTPASTDGTATIPPACTKNKGDVLSCEFTTLTPEKPYTFVVRAINTAGDSETASTPALIPNVPDKPAGVVVTVPAPGSATVTWAAPTGANVTDGWTVSATSADIGAASVPDCTVAEDDPRTCAFTGLTASAQYTVVITATNEAGPTESDPIGPIMANNPAAPGIPTGEVIAEDTVRLVWTEAPPTSGTVAGYSVAAYTAQAPGTPITSAGCTDVTELTCDFDGLDPDETYTFRVIALGSGGGSTTGLRSTPITTAGPAQPDAPTVALEGNAVRVTWVAPVSDGPILSYSVASDPDVSAPARCTNVRVLNCLFDRLDGGTEYTFTVSANGTAGRSVASDTSAAITVPPPAVTQPNAPGTPATEVVTGNRVRLTWTAPLPGGAPVTTYTVHAFTAAAPGVAITSGACTDVTGLSCEFDGLSEAETYTFRVTANAAGGSAQGARSGAVSTAAPGKPATPTVELAGPRSVRVTWQAPAGGPVAGYSVVSDPDVSAPARCTNVRALTCVFDRLQAGTSYTFRVFANGTGGRSTASDASVAIVAGPPTTLAAPTVTPGTSAGQVVVSWTAPSSSSEIANYQVASTPGGVGCSPAPGPTGTSCVVAGLTPGTSYTFRVRPIGAGNSGDAAWSPASEPIAAGAPGAPTDVEVAAGNGQISVSWTLPVNVDQVVRYRAVAAPGGASCETDTNTGTECVITGVENLRSYTVTVISVGANDVTSLPSAPSARVRPTAGAPGSPTGVTATPAGDGVAVSWTAPASAGNGIVRYIVTAAGPTGAPRTCETANGTTLTCTIPGLTVGTAYAVTVVAVGRAASGYSAPSAAVTFTPKAPPAVPTNVAVGSTVARSLAVTWKAGTLVSGSDTLAGFTATATPAAGGTPLTCVGASTATSCTISNVPPGAYTVSVVARGTTAGVQSAPSSAVDTTALFAVAPVLGTTLAASNGSLTISPTTGKLGGTLTVSGAGFAPFTAISLGFYPTLAKVTVPATVVTNANGSFTADVTIPAGALGTGVTTATKTLAAAGMPPTGTTVRTLTGPVTVTAS
jgi:Fibronectin type III domain